MKRADMNEELAALLDEIPVSIRVANCFLNSGITTLGELVQKRKCDLMAIQNFGARCLREVEELLQERGLALAPNDFGPRVLSKRAKARQANRHRHMHMLVRADDKESRRVRAVANAVRVKCGMPLE